MKNKNSHDVLIQQFEQRKIDVLVGTQMVSLKDLLYKIVNLVIGKAFSNENIKDNL